MTVTKEQFKEIMKRFKVEALTMIKANAPYRTGRLKASIRSKTVKDGFTISINVWYFIYTEMRWTYNRRWKKTLINPNEAWLKRTIETLLLKWSNELGGKINAS